MFNRVCVLVLDSVGIGAMHDAADFGDEGAHTLGNIFAARGKLEIPNLLQMGLGNIFDSRLPSVANPTAAFGRMAEITRAKDTTSGHWEMMGLVTEPPFCVVKNFPDEILTRIAQKFFCEKNTTSQNFSSQQNEKNFSTQKYFDSRQNEKNFSTQKNFSSQQNEKNFSTQKNFSSQQNEKNFSAQKNFSSRQNEKLWLGNFAASGTKIIDDLGEEHMKTGLPIVYTSADSVFQIAAHEEIIPLPLLYKLCETARELLTGDLLVGRVIARPFLGKPGAFFRTENRKDFAAPPHKKTLLDVLEERGQTTLGIGKIEDIFCKRGVKNVNHTKNNCDGISATIDALKNNFSD
ncbi:MAG: hypothetical protein FWD19_01270, partial [Defluviitaleaceae bacterium]|nr:hypothetical protein [Defluviitaleaceae bacterium]